MEEMRGCPYPDAQHESRFTYRSQNFRYVEGEFRCSREPELMLEVLYAVSEGDVENLNAFQNEVCRGAQHAQDLSASGYIPPGFS
jgi:hypothetical protein